jgi:hypothetical protein
VSTRRKRFLVAGLAEEALAGPEHNREDLQPQFVDEVVLHQRVYELEACGDDDFPIELVLQLRDLVEHVALEHVELFQSGSSRCAAARRPGGLIVVPKDVVHPGLLGGWGCRSHQSQGGDPDEVAR